MVPDAEIKHEVHKTGLRMADLVLALSALFISLCSLGLAIHQGYAMDRLVEANSQPVLEFQSGNVDPQQRSQPMLWFGVENPGAGTARIEWFKIEVYGHEVRDWREALPYARARAVSSGSPAASLPFAQVITGPVAHTYLKYGDRRRIFTWLRSSENAPLWDVIDGAAQAGVFHLAACYCSIFDQCWIADNQGGWPQRVRSCVAGRPSSRGRRTAEPG